MLFTIFWDVRAPCMWPYSSYFVLDQSFFHKNNGTYDEKKEVIFFIIINKNKRPDCLKLKKKQAQWFIRINSWDPI